MLTYFSFISVGYKILSRSYVGTGMTKLNATLYKYMDITGTRFYFKVVDGGCIPLMTDTTSPNWLGGREITQFLDTFYNSIIV